VIDNLAWVAVSSVVAGVTITVLLAVHAATGELVRARDLLA
jgi:hypothetical protein